MPKKPTSKNNGAANRRSRGLRAVLIPLTAEQHALVVRAAGRTIPPGPAVSRWAAGVLEAAARLVLEMPPK